MIQVQAVVERVASGTIPVLILGETGTGKELVAQELHRRGIRRRQPLRVVNCAAIPENLIGSELFGHVRGAFTGADRAHRGVFESANGGTVFLDEVGELSASAQATLLRVLDTGKICPVGSAQEISVEVRVIAATHRDLSLMVREGTFRLDLYHRLNALTIELPPLRERLEEVLPLAELFIERLATCTGERPRRIHESAARCLLAHRWPGNVRELRNVIERAVALADGDYVTEAELPPPVRLPEGGSPSAAPGTRDCCTSFVHPKSLPNGGIDLRAALQDYELSLIRSALKQANGHQKTAAALLNLPLRTFERKLQKLPPSERGRRDSTEGRVEMQQPATR